MSIKPDADSFIFVDHKSTESAKIIFDSRAVDPNVDLRSAGTPGPDDGTDDGLLLPAVRDHGLLLPAVQDHGLLLPAVQDQGLLLPAVQLGDGLLLPY